MFIRIYLSEITFVAVGNMQRGISAGPQNYVNITMRYRDRVGLTSRGPNQILSMLIGRFAVIISCRRSSDEAKRTIRDLR